MLDATRTAALSAYVLLSLRLWEPGYKERYYRMKFGVELSDVDFRKEWVSPGLCPCVCPSSLFHGHRVVKSYLEGLSWVLHYYYQGVR